MVPPLGNLIVIVGMLTKVYKKGTTMAQKVYGPIVEYPGVISIWKKHSIENTWRIVYNALKCWMLTELEGKAILRK